MLGRVLAAKDQLNGATIVLITKGNEVCLKLGLRPARSLRSVSGDGRFLGELPQKRRRNNSVSAGCNGSKGKK
jgi:hypothetical protein